jgi:RHS repeat-associated protein
MGCPRLTYEEENGEIFFQGLWKKSASDFFRVDYYPFGLQTANSWTRENTTTNNFLYNGGTELNTTTSVYDLHYRNYDPALGRMNQVDPLASKYAGQTPYNYAFNSPTVMNDPLGDESVTGGKAYCSWCYFKPRPIDTGTAGGGGGGGGGITRSGNTWTIDFGKIGPYGGTWNHQSGYSDFSNASAWQFVGEYVDRFGAPKVAFGDRATASERMKLAIHKYNGDFVQINSQGRVFVPYTNISYWDYLASKTSTESMVDKIWNSWLARRIIPDNITLDVSYGATLVAGGNLTYTLNILTRGEAPGLYLTRTFIVNYGGEIGYGVNLGTMLYNKDIRTMKPSSLLGMASNVSGGAGVGANFNFGYESTDSSLLNPLWQGMSVGVGDTVGAAVGTGTTTPIGILVPISMGMPSFMFIPTGW